MSVLAQVAIDNAKRRFDINLTEEIQRIKKDMDIKTNKYPNFWKIIKKGFNASNINPNLNCPMNYLYDLKLDKYREIDKSLPMSYFFNKFELDVNRKTCKKVEDLITKYSFDLSQFHIDSASTSDSSEEYLLFRSDFEVLIRDIQKTYISGNYVGLMSWLIDRAFIISPSIKQNNASLKSTMNKNKPLLLKVLYDVNKGNLLKCFSKNLTF